MGRIGFIHHDIFLNHDTGHSHPENHLRLEYMYEHLRGISLGNRIVDIEAEPTDIRTLQLVHDEHYIDYVRKTCEEHEAAALDDGDTRVCKASFDVSLYAAGAVIQAVNLVDRGDFKRVFVAARPPGHHSMPNHAMGFCLFNNVAIAARYAQRKLGFRRIMILDWDVHHGNGTQDAFYSDPTVLFCSLHQFPFYPGTGSASERGSGDGLNYTLNIPMLEGSEIEDYREAMQNQVFPVAAAFEPELLLVSAGFDAHISDPLANINLNDEDFYELTQMAIDIAESHCKGRLVSVLEGGYHREALTRCTLQHLMALADVPK